MRQCKRLANLGGQGPHDIVITAENLCAHTVGNTFNIVVSIQSLDKIFNRRDELFVKRIITYFNRNIHLSKFSVKLAFLKKAAQSLLIEFMERKIIVIAAFFGALAVLAGAFGAHALKERLSMTDLLNFETAVRYQMMHALALLGLGAVWHKLNIIWTRWAFHAWWIGIIFFSGSLYLLSTREFTGWTLSWIWPITPLGGFLMVTGWVLLGLSAWLADDDIKD